MHFCYLVWWYSSYKVQHVNMHINYVDMHFFLMLACNLFWLTCNLFDDDMQFPRELIFDKEQHASVQYNYKTKFV